MLNEVKHLNRFFANAQNDNFELAIGIRSSIKSASIRLICLINVLFLKS